MEKKDIKNNFKEYDTNLVSKYYNREHLIDPLESSYSSFLEDSLEEFFRQNEKIIMLSQIDKKKNIIVDYYLNMGKHSLEINHYKGPDRIKKAINSEVATKYNLTRELNLNLQMYLSSKIRGTEEEEIITRKKVKYEIGKIPLLVNSRYDPYAQKSLVNPYHFVVNGSCRLLYNLLEPNTALKIIKSNKQGIYIRYSRDKKYNNQSLIGYYTDNIGISVPVIASSKFNIFLLLRLLGVSLEKILETNQNKDKELELFNLAYDYYTKPLGDLITEYITIGKLPPIGSEETQHEVHERVLTSIKNLFFPSSLELDLEHNWKELKKGQILELLKELIYYKNNPEEVPYIDSLAHKKLFSIKNHFERVFQQSFKEIISKGKIIILRDLGLIRRTKSLSHLVRSDIIKKSFRKYLTQGTSSSINVPQSEHLNYTNITSIASAQRKIVSSLNKTLTHEKYRCINPSKSGRICCVQTPHSRSVGLVEYLALGSICSSAVNFEELKPHLGELGSFEEGEIKGSIYINDKIVGYVKEDVSKVEDRLLKLKRKLPIGVVVKENKIYINCSEGRILKPFYLVQKEEPIILKLSLEQFISTDIKSLISRGYITYLDFQEELNYKIAPTIEDITKETQVLHVNPAVYLSYSGSGLPLVSTNAAHRAALALRLTDQSIGGKLDKAKFKYNELKIQYLVNSNPSILRTSFDDHLIENIGQNLIVAFMHGQNEEDSVVINKSSIERGLLDSVMWKRILKEIAKDQNNKFNYEINDKLDFPILSLEEDSLPKVGSLVNEDVVLVVDEGNLNRPTKVNSPHTHYYINEIAIDTPIEEAPLVEFKFSKLRKVGEGDKIGTRYGLKGILSKPVSELDLVIPKNGSCPSLIISNHVINSRMIIGPLLELYLTKAAVLEGKPIVAPVFVEENTIPELVSHAKQILIKNNYDGTGYDELFDVCTNTMKKVYVGPTKTHLLEHYARDKFYTRAHKGGLNALTRQPGEGRASKGGLKFSEMESNAALEHNAAEFIKDRLGVDVIKVKICNCGYIWDIEKENVKCEICGLESSTTTVTLPYAFVILTKILKAGHIGTKFNLKKEHIEQPEELEIDELPLDLEEEMEKLEE